MNAVQLAALDEFLYHPVQVAHWSGFQLLNDKLHKQWIREIISGNADCTIQAHRGSYKTTCLQVALAILMVTNTKKNIIFLRKADNDVTEVIKTVRQLIESAPFRALTSKLYGSAVNVTRASATQLQCDAYTSPRGAVQLLGIGTGGSITGKHADIIITDDIINVKDRVSRAERERTKLIYQELQNIRNRGGRIVNTGTPWHKEDAFCLMPNVQKFDCYQTGLITKDKLQQLRNSMSPSLFAANYELRHVASENALFAESPKYCEEMPVNGSAIAHIDAAYGGQDYTALTIAQRAGGKLCVYGRIWRKHIDTVLDAVLTECERFRAQPIYCENNGDKGYLAKELRRNGVQVRVYHESMNKYAKIATYLRKWWSSIQWVEGTDAEYLAQIMDYTEDAEHDDAPDSAACICRILDRGQYDGLT